VPTNKVQAKERTIRAAQKEGLVAKSATVAPDGTITVSLSPQRELSVDLGDMPNEWDKHVKPTA